MSDLKAAAVKVWNDPKWEEAYGKEVMDRIKKLRILKSMTLIYDKSCASIRHTGETASGGDPQVSLAFFLSMIDPP